MSKKGSILNSHLSCPVVLLLAFLSSLAGQALTLFMDTEKLTKQRENSQLVWLYQSNTN